MQYLLKYDYIPDVLEKRGPYRQGHLDLAQKLIDQGRCLSGGPTTTPVGAKVPTGALFIFTDAEAAQQFVEQDPYVSAGIVTGHTVEEWNVARPRLVRAHAPRNPWQGKDSCQIRDMMIIVAT